MKLTLVGANPAEVTTICTNLAHLVRLLSHYLSLRLPAEITLPHSDDALPTILPPTTSYVGHQARFSSASPAPSSSNSPSSSRALHTSRRLAARPLYLKKKLSLLAKDDTPACAAFVEGVTLLAWNIAWLCKTQGIDVGSNSWEEVCDIGKNLRKFFDAEQSGLSGLSAAQDARTKPSTVATAQNPAPAAPPGVQYGTAARTSPSFGQFSHNTVQSNLTSASGGEWMRGWRLRDPEKVIERVKHMLQSDRTGAGWELLEGKEWETESTIADHTTPAHVGEASTVVVNRRSAPDNELQEPNSKSRSPAEENEQDQIKGTSGWTKLKSR